MTSEETIRRANEARQLLANPLLLEAFQRCEKEGFEGALEAFDSAERDRCLLIVNVVRDVRLHLEEMIMQGDAEVRRRPTAA